MISRLQMVSNDGQSAFLTQNCKKVKLQLVGGECAAFQILPATYLPGEEFPLTKNSENRGFKIIVVKLEHITKGTIRVDFIQMDGKSKPLANFADLAEW
jgi:hypothetical protein